MTNDLCPCGSGKTYAECCEPIIKGQVKAPTPEALMRSRYTAYAKHEIPWLRDSLEENQRKDFDEKNVETWSRQSEWMGMEIRRTEKGGPEDTTGFVEFVAKFKQEGVVREHHELGEFHKVNEQWFFYDGRGIKPAPFKHDKPQVGRNDPCPCGSGKKFKKCCGA
ncbi:MAG TPA: YchJ family protein [Fibrobacteraceae bacterium]|nr:YchJ family protein [Fibrobacteraceae bacterium]